MGKSIEGWLQEEEEEIEPSEEEKKKQKEEAVERFRKQFRDIPDIKLGEEMSEREKMLADAVRSVPAYKQHRGYLEGLIPEGEKKEEVDYRALARYMGISAGEAYVILYDLIEGEKELKTSKLKK
ncbi:MAG: hypothetical protein ACTSYA_00745 [Candidatus Kariarchaeaceae archaeon]